jgi:hypothetical protein
MTTYMEVIIHSQWLETSVVMIQPSSGSTPGLFVFDGYVLSELHINKEMKIQI